jgi:hypothetical protein
MLCSIPLLFTGGFAPAPPEQVRNGAPPQFWGPGPKTNPAKLMSIR